ncbi:MAG: hypothetical protein QM496_01805 [Verrucomicrobiota bacterium]
MSEQVNMDMTYPKWDYFSIANSPDGRRNFRNIRARDEDHALLTAKNHGMRVNAKTRVTRIGQDGYMRALERDGGFVIEREGVVK